MSLKDDLKKEIKGILDDKWVYRDGTIVPESEKLKLGNDGVKLEGTVLYADLAASTNLVDNFKPWFAAEIYKSYLHCAAKIIKARGGVITSYDGDRIMAIYIGDQKNSNAAETALAINYAVVEIINPAFKLKYPEMPYTVKQVVGIDTSNLLVARTGVRGANDLVWIGRAANYAAKLTELPSKHTTYITKAVYDRLNKTAKLSVSGTPMWEKSTWTSMNDSVIYRSNWRRSTHL